jgi:hypothetical protein
MNVGAPPLRFFLPQGWETTNPKTSVASHPFRKYARWMGRGALVRLRVCTSLDFTRRGVSSQPFGAGFSVCGLRLLAVRGSYYPSSESSDTSTSSVQALVHSAFCNKGTTSVGPLLQDKSWLAIIEIMVRLIYMPGNSRAWSSLPFQERTPLPRLTALASSRSRGPERRFCRRGGSRLRRRCR